MDKDRQNKKLKALLKRHVSFINLFRVISLILFLWILSVLFYKAISGTTGFEVITLLPLSIVFFFLALSLNSKTKSTYSRELVFNFSQIVFCSVLLLSGILLLNYSRNTSTVLYEGEYFNRNDINIQFRDDMTFKVRKSNLISADIEYGAYTQVGTMLILEDDMFFGATMFKDTLYIIEDGIWFELESPWRRTENGTLRFKSITHK